ncbi:hypothetical protein ASE12_15220 [Aeromicrobium sp. Root236]|nr:hypothetical protein ASE12_15220 [Aeromicrobium sp. Root236]
MGRASKPRAWWRDAVFPVVFAAWMTISYLVSPDRKGAWVLVVTWMIAGALAAWPYYCHRAGRDLSDTRLDRWAEAHPVRFWSAFGGVAALVFVIIQIT